MLAAPCVRVGWALSEPCPTRVAAGEWGAYGARGPLRDCTVLPSPIRDRRVSTSPAPSPASSNSASSFLKGWGRCWRCSKLPCCGKKKRSSSNHRYTAWQRSWACCG
eukprot:scaffold4518_cov410-Prasinococcus_capsulatus_cf.AAC.24